MADHERSRSESEQAIDAARRRIDALDDQLVQLVERRVQLVTEVHRNKALTQRAARDQGREQEMVARLQSRVPRIGIEGVSWLMRTVVDVCLDAASTDAGLPPPREMFDISAPSADLATVVRCATALAAAGINIDAVNYSRDGGDYALHLLVQDGAAALDALQRIDMDTVTGKRVLVFTLPNRPGTLARYTGALDGVTVDFIYQATAKGVVIGAPDLDAVQRAFNDTARR
ncbi:MAG: chorismate mutase [Candidatus Dormibacteria bacterium]